MPVSFTPRLSCPLTEISGGLQVLTRKESQDFFSLRGLSWVLLVCVYGCDCELPFSRLLTGERRFAMKSALTLTPAHGEERAHFVHWQYEPQLTIDNTNYASTSNDVNKPTSIHLARFVASGKHGRRHVLFSSRADRSVSPDVSKTSVDR